MRPLFSLFDKTFAEVAEAIAKEKHASQSSLKTSDESVSPESVRRVEQQPSGGAAQASKAPSTDIGSPLVRNPARGSSSDLAIDGRNRNGATTEFSSGGDKSIEQEGGSAIMKFQDDSHSDWDDTDITLHVSEDDSSFTAVHHPKSSDNGNSTSTSDS